MRYKKLNLYHTWTKQDIQKLQDIIEQQQLHSKNKRVSWVQVLKELNNPNFTLTQIKSQYYNLSLNKQIKQTQECDSTQESVNEIHDSFSQQDENGSIAIDKQQLELFTHLVNSIAIE